MRVDDLMITAAYFSVPLQLVVSLYRYPRLQQMPLHILILVILFALFIFLCGFGHALRCSGNTDTRIFEVTNSLTALVSMATAIYLLPLVPNLMNSLDKTLQDLIKLNEETESSKRQLISFMAFLCHELRTPLFAITSTISFLQEDDDDLSEEQISSLDSIKQNSDLMLRVVNEVLDINCLESGKVLLEEEEFNLHKMLKNLHRSMAMKCFKRNGNAVEFRFHVAAGVPEMAKGDTTRIMQVVLNLLSNAIKFTERGFVYSSIEALSVAEALQKNLIQSPTSDSSTCDSSCSELEQQHSEEGEKYTRIKPDLEEGCSVALLQSSTKGGRVIRLNEKSDSFVLQIKVRDTGIGVPQDRLDHIFKPYNQAKLSQYRKYGGTGLGLAILSKLVHLMGGKIFVRSIVGEGSTFEVCIPLQAVSSESTMHCRAKKELSLQKIPLSVDVMIEDDLCGRNSHHENDTGRGPAGIMPAVCSRANDSADFPKKEDTVESNQPDWLDDVTQQSVAPSTLSPPADSAPAGIACEGLAGVFENSPAQQGEKPSKTATVVKKRKKPSLPKFDMPANRGLVLVVDDNQLNRKLIGKMLFSFNLEYRQATNGQEAVDIMLSSKNFTGDPKDPHFGFVIMDLSMPVLDGCEATALIRQNNMNLPIMALTAATIEEGREKAFSAGVTDYETKPILRQNLHAKCTKYLSPSLLAHKTRLV